MQPSKLFLPVLLAVLVVPSLALADPISAAIVSFATSIGFSTAAATAFSTFVVTNLVSAAVPCSRRVLLGRSKQAGE